MFNVNTKDAWVASSKAHVLSHPHILAVYVIGLKIPRCRAELASNLRVHNVVSATANHPEAWSVVPEDRIVVSGGVVSPWVANQTPGQLLVGSFGSSNGRSWGAKTKDHLLEDRMSNIVLAYTLPRSVGGVNLKGTNSVATVDRPSGLGEARAQVVGALTGIGGWTHFGGEGRMLTRMGPVNHGLCSRRDRGVEQGPPQRRRRDHLRQRAGDRRGHRPGPLPVISEPQGPRRGCGAGSNPDRLAASGPGCAAEELPRSETRNSAWICLRRRACRLTSQRAAVALCT